MLFENMQAKLSTTHRNDCITLSACISLVKPQLCRLHLLPCYRRDVIRDTLIATSCCGSFRLVFFATGVNGIRLVFSICLAIEGPDHTWAPDSHDNTTGSDHCFTLI